MAASRFAQTSVEERKEKLLKLNNKKTLKVNRGAAKVFKDYLTVKGESENFEDFDCVKLDELLGQFYMDLRREDGTHYKINSLETIRRGINRYLKSPPFNRKLDIIKDSSFIDSTACFRAVLAEAKRTGKGRVVHHPVISDTDLKLLYNSKHMSITTPQGLLNKVQFDIRMFFCGWGNENMHAMTKNMFKVETDEDTGRKVVKKNVDEVMLNHCFDKETAPAMMPEIKGSMYCPVLSFERYLSKLNPDCVKLWQRPKDSVSDSDTVWYCNVAVGEKKLSKFLTSLSKATNLSKVYTNNSIRATGSSILSRCIYGPSQEMYDNGCQSVQSHSVNQPVNYAENIEIGESLGDPRCPVSSFKKYSSKLHPDNPNFWQRPKKKFNKFKDTDEAWYDNAAVGKNTLYAFMSNLSDEANLSQRYTNHCIRATSITTLDSQGVEANDIMGISGHKHKRSIKSYNSKLDDQKKREMSDILCKNLPSKSSDVESVNTMSSDLSNQDSCVFSEKEDHLPGKNEYRNILTGDAASAWKRLIGRFYWLNDSEVAKHLIEIHESCCLGTCPLEKTHDEQKSVPESPSKQQVPDLIPSAQTCGENRDISLQLEVDDGADSIDDDSSDDSDLDMDSEEEFDIKQEQESMDDTPPTSPNTESTSHKDDRLAPSTIKQSIDSGGDNLSHTFTAVKQEPVETYSIIFASETSTTDNSRLPLDTIKTDSSDSSKISSSCSISRSSVTNSTATQGTALVKRAIPTALVLNTRQRPDMIGTGALNTVTSSVVQMPPLTQKSSMTQPQTTVTPSVSIVRAPFPLPITLNTGLIGNVLNVPCNTGVHGNVLNAPQTGVVRNVLNAPQTGVVRNVLNVPQNTSMVGNVLQVLQNTSAVRNVLNAPQNTDVVSNVLPQSTSVVGNVLNAPQNAGVVGNVLNAPQNSSVVGNVLQVPQKIPFYTVQRGNTLYLQQASTPLVPTQTFLNVLNSQDTTLDHPVGPSIQSTPQVSQGLPLAANFGMLQSIDPTSIQRVCDPPTTAVTLQKGEQQGQTDKQTDQKNDNRSQAAEENLTNRESLKRTLSESDKETGMGKRLVTQQQ